MYLPCDHLTSVRGWSATTQLCRRQCSPQGVLEHGVWRTASCGSFLAAPGPSAPARDLSPPRLSSCSSRSVLCLFWGTCDPFPDNQKPSQTSRYTDVMQYRHQQLARLRLARVQCMWCAQQGAWQRAEAESQHACYRTLRSWGRTASHWPPPAAACAPLASPPPQTPPLSCHPRRRCSAAACLPSQAAPARTEHHQLSALSRQCSAMMRLWSFA